MHAPEYFVSVCHDRGARSTEVQTKAAREKKEIESIMQPKDLEARKAEEQKAATDQKKQRKPPTLPRKGEEIKKQPFISAPF